MPRSAFLAFPSRPLHRGLLAAALATLVAFLSAAAPHPALPLLPPPATRRPITPQYLQDVLYFLASDALQGRYTPSPGLDIADLYVASNLAQWGFVGAGDPPAQRDPKLGPLAQFLYHFDLESVGLNPSVTEVTLNGRVYRAGDGFNAAAVAGMGSGKLVFVKDGYVRLDRPSGWSRVKAAPGPAPVLNPFRGLNLQGKIVVVDGEPSPMMAYQSALLNEQYNGGAAPVPVNAMGRPGIDYETPQQYAAAHGALAVISGNLPMVATSGLAAIAPAPAEGDPNPYPRPAPNVPPMVVTRFQPPQPPIPSLVAGDALWTALQASRHNPSARLSFRVALTRGPGCGTRAQSRPWRDCARPSVKPVAPRRQRRSERARGPAPVNARTHDVIAVLPGSDPVLRHQYVMFSAHLDHLGVAPTPINGDSIYNGADDDGSGSTALLALARAFAAGPRPRRSLVFMWHAGEEEGLWGSLYFTRFPTLPLAHIVTEINMDMIGRSKPSGDTDPRDKRLTGPNEIYAIGPEVSSSDLEHTLDAVNASTAHLTLNHFYDRTNDPQRIFYRSDQFNYAAHGIPILFLFDGVHRDYHQVGDEPQKIDYAKITRVARLVYALGWQLANQPSTPRLNPHLPVALRHAMAEAKAGDLEP